MPTPRKTKQPKHLCPACNTGEEPVEYPRREWKVLVCVKCGEARLDIPFDDLPWWLQSEAARHLAEFAPA